MQSVGKEVCRAKNKMELAIDFAVVSKIQSQLRFTGHPK